MCGPIEMTFAATSLYMSGRELKGPNAPSLRKPFYDW